MSQNISDHKNSSKLTIASFKLYKKILNCRGRRTLSSRDIMIYDGNFNGDVLQNKIIVDGKQRDRIISSPNGLINNALVLQTTST